MAGHVIGYGPVLACVPVMTKWGLSCGSVSSILIRPPASEVPVTSVAAAIASEAIRIGFSYYLARVARYDLLYGALGSVFAFLLVVYLQAIVLLLGAEIAQSWSQSAYGPQEAPVPFSKQARDMVRRLFVRRP